MAQDDPARACRLLLGSLGRPTSRARVVTISAARLGQIADLLEADGHFAEAAELRPRRGRPPVRRNANGFTAAQERTADLWCDIADRIEAGEDEADVLAVFESDPRVAHLKPEFRETFLSNLRDLAGRADVI